jgi:hypothetical protein
MKAMRGKVTLEIDTEQVIGHGDIAWETWCEKLNEFLHDQNAELPEGISFIPQPDDPGRDLGK